MLKTVDRQRIQQGDLLNIRDFQGPFQSFVSGSMTTATVLRQRWWLQVVARVQTGVSATPPWGWWNTAEVVLSSQLDPSATDNPPDDEMGTPGSTGFTPLFPVVTGNDAASSYDVVFSIPTGVLELTTAHAGNAAGPIPHLNGWLFCEDQHGVFFNAASYAVHFGYVGYFSVVWGYNL